MTAETQKSVAEKIGLFRRFFTGLSHVYGTYDARTGRGWQVKQPVTNDVILAHLQGRQSYGVYLLVKDRTRAVAVDFDTDDPVPAMEFVAAAGPYGLHAYIERSKSKGYHTWIFFAPGSVLAAKARLVVHHILAEIHQPHIEVFPKHDALDTRTTYGNFINAPLFGALVPLGRTVFVHKHDPFKPYPDQWEFLEQVECASETQLDEIIAINELDHPAEGPPRARATSVAQSLPALGLPLCAQRMLAEGVTQNQRVACFRLAVHLRRVGLPHDLAVAALASWAAKNRPVDEKRIITPPEIEAQAASAYEGSYRSCGCEDPTVAQFCDPQCRLRVAGGFRPRATPNTAEDKNRTSEPAGVT